MYGKHYESMYTGSMVGAGAVVFAVWGYVISHVRPPDYQLELNPKLLAFTLGEPEARVVEAITKLCSPDSASRSQDEEGRRLLRRGTYLYYVVNGSAYSKIRNEEEKKAYWRDQKKRQRESVPEKVSEVSKKYHPDSRTVLHLLNELSGRRFRETEENLGFISARLKEPGVDLAGVRLMLSRQCQIWRGTTMAEYLKPETLFNKAKFDGYYAGKDLPVETKPTNQTGPKLTTQADAINRQLREMDQAAEQAMKL